MSAIAVSRSEHTYVDYLISWSDTVGVFELLIPNKIETNEQETYTSSPVVQKYIICRVELMSSPYKELDVKSVYVKLYIHF